MFITFEGTDCVGKSTQAKLLANRLENEGHTVVCTHEPGGTEIGKQCRQILKHSTVPIFPETELLLMNASRAQLVREVIQPALSLGHVVISDRYYDSTLAYQHYGRMIDMGQVREVIACAIDGCSPDLTLLLTVKPETVRERKAFRGDKVHDRFEAAGDSFMAKVDRGFAELARAFNRIKVVPADSSADRVAEAVWAQVTLAMSKRVQGRI